MIYVVTLYILQAQNKQNGEFAALKKVEIKTEEDLEDFTVEIDILYECRHENVVALHEAYFYDDFLWVSMFCSLDDHSTFLKIDKGDSLRWLVCYLNVRFHCFLF